MASNLHKDLSDAQLHVPKGFAGASNSTKCTKDASGNLVWASDTDANNTRVGFSWRGNRKPRNASEYTSWYCRAITTSASYDNQIIPATITTANAISMGSWVVPINCDVEQIVCRSASGHATMTCSLAFIVLRYDCATSPSTIVEAEICKVLDEDTHVVGEIKCTKIDSGFTTSSLLEGDIVVCKSMGGTIAMYDFEYQVSFLCKTT